IIAGRIETGSMRVGDMVLFSPSNQSAQVRSIESWNSPPSLEARAGQSVGITLDKPIFVERGSVASGQQNAPALTSVFGATLFWLGKHPLCVGNNYRMKLATRETKVVVQQINRIVDTVALRNVPGDQLMRDNVGEVVLRSTDLLAVDEGRIAAATSRLVLLEGFDTVGGGLISMHGYPDERKALMIRASNVSATVHEVAREDRAIRNL